MKGTLWHEADGSFNPGWALFIAFAAVGLGACCAAFIIAALNPKAWPLAGAALSFIAFAMLCTAIIVVPIARAKLLAPALKEAAGGISKAVGPPFPGMDMNEQGDAGRD